MLKITGGKLKGRKITTPKGKDTRPTLERTREAVFNVLRNHIDLSEFVAIDLFAGSGAYGFEAISRGARRSIFLDISKTITRLIHSNAERLGIKDQVEIYMKDATIWLKKEAFETQPVVFFVDPPYASGLAQTTIDILSTRLNPDSRALLVIESDTKTGFQLSSQFITLAKKEYGNSKVSFLQYDQPRSNES